MKIFILTFYNIIIIVIVHLLTIDIITKNFKDLRLNFLYFDF